jgi:hypothetical protein
MLLFVDVPLDEERQLRIFHQVIKPDLPPP